MELRATLMVVLLAICCSAWSGLGGEDYVRPPPRKALSFPWKRKHSSNPQQVHCTYTEPDYSLPWQKQRQYIITGSAFMIGDRKLLTNAHCIEHGTQRGLSASTLASSFGKVAISRRKLSDYKAEDLSIDLLNWFRTSGTPLPEGHHHLSIGDRP